MLRDTLLILGGWLVGGLVTIAISQAVFPAHVDVQASSGNSSIGSIMDYWDPPPLIDPQVKAIMTQYRDEG